MSRRCSHSRQARDNPGARLGAAIAIHAARGNSRLALLTSPSVASLRAVGGAARSLRAWARRARGLCRSSTGQSRRQHVLGGERLLVYVRLEGDDNAATDAVADSAAQDREPLITLKLGERSELWGEFYRWEFATAVAGALLGVNPFDQPDVEVSKRMATSALDRAGGADDAPGGVSPAELLADAQPGGYRCHPCAFVRRTAELDSALAELRRHNRRGATASQPPRATGRDTCTPPASLHKGGPANGRSLQVLERPRADCAGDLAVPVAGYTFGRLARAQADGDLGALASLGRPVSRVYVEGTGAEDVMSLAGCRCAASAGGNRLVQRGLHAQFDVAGQGLRYRDSRPWPLRLPAGRRLRRCRRPCPGRSGRSTRP